MSKTKKNAANRILYVIRTLMLLFVLVGFNTMLSFVHASEVDYGKITNPVFPGEVVVFTGYYGDTLFEYEMSIGNVLRGAEAENYALSINPYNDIPYGTELFIFDVDFKLNYYESYDSTAMYVSSYDFTGYTSNKAQYNSSTYIVLDNDFGGYVYPGGIMEGKAYILAPYGDSPYIEFSPFYSTETSVYFRPDPNLIELSIPTFSTGGKTVFNINENTTLTANASGGNNRTYGYYYMFEAVNPDGTYELIQDWSTKNTTTWTPKQYGKYKLYVNVADNGEGYLYRMKEVSVIPPSPINLKASSSSYNSIKLTWDPVAGATSYAVYRSTTLDGTYSIVGTAVNNYTHIGLISGNTYYYKVKAVVTNNTTKIYSNFSLTTSGTPIPSIPTNFNAVKVDAYSNKLSWNAVTGASVYVIYRSTSLNGPYSTVGTSATSYVHSNLNANTVYYYKIRPYTLVGSNKVYGEFSSTKSVSSVPTGLKAESASYNSIKLSWAPVLGATGYKIYRSSTSTGSYSAITETTAASFTNSNLTTNTTYYYKIKAYTQIGTVKEYSNYSIVVSQKPIPSAPSFINSVSSGYNSVNSTWGAVTGANGYELHRSTSKSGTYTLVTSTTATTYNNIGLTTGNTYYYKVRSYRLVGTTKIFGNFTTAVAAKPIPNVPANFSVIRAGSTSIKLSWNAVAGASGYEIYRSTSSGGTYSLLKKTNLLYYTNTGLSTGSYYYYKIRSYKVIGTSNIYSSWSTVKYAKP